jgi:CheY-like chemotaxis protein
LNHDVRTPLNGILAASQLLRTNAASVDQRALVEDIATSAADLHRTLGPFLGSEPLSSNPGPSGPEAPNSAGSDRRLRVLAADDHVINLHMIEAILDPVADVAMAENGAEALEAVTSTDFDLVLLDVQMPIMDGLTTVREIRKLGLPRGATPVIMVTANARPDDERASLDAGANLHMTKPIHPGRLLGAVLDHARP